MTKTFNKKIIFYASLLLAIFITLAIGWYFWSIVILAYALYKGFFKKNWFDDGTDF